jgi:predicted transcriptional regulator of viral defense system
VQRRLLALLDEVRRVTADRTGLSLSRLPSSSATLTYLVEEKLVREVAVEEAAPGFTPYWLTLRGVSQANRPDPFELLSGVHPSGTIGHISALLFHGLSNLRTNMHFVVLPRPRRPVAAKATPPRPSKKGENAEDHAPAPKNGVRMFMCEGLDYRKRDTYEDLLVGRSVYPLDESQDVAVFDRERALLFSVTDPACNGGARGVVEAWERAAGSVEEHRIVEYAGVLSAAWIWRKVGAIADFVGMSTVVAAARTAVGAQELDPIPLISHVREGRLVEPWKVVVPW